MSTADKTLERMRRNPAGDWRIEDLRVVAERHGCVVRKPKSGSHWYFTHPAWRDELSVPFARPIKAVYVRRLVQLLDDLEG